MDLIAKKLAENEISKSAWALSNTIHRNKSQSDRVVSHKKAVFGGAQILATFLENEDWILKTASESLSFLKANYEEILKENYPFLPDNLYGFSQKELKATVIENSLELIPQPIELSSKFKSIKNLKLKGRKANSSSAALKQTELMFSAMCLIAMSEKNDRAINPKYLFECKGCESSSVLELLDISLYLKKEGLEYPNSIFKNLFVTELDTAPRAVAEDFDKIINLAYSLTKHDFADFSPEHNTNLFKGTISAIHGTIGSKGESFLKSVTPLFGARINSGLDQFIDGKADFNSVLLDIEQLKNSEFGSKDCGLKFIQTLEKIDILDSPIWTMGLGEVLFESEKCLFNGESNEVSKLYFSIVGAVSEELSPYLELNLVLKALVELVQSEESFHTLILQERLGNSNFKKVIDKENAQARKLLSSCFLQFILELIEHVGIESVAPKAAFSSMIDRAIRHDVILFGISKLILLIASEFPSIEDRFRKQYRSLLTSSIDVAKKWIDFLIENGEPLYRYNSFKEFIAYQANAVFAKESRITTEADFDRVSYRKSLSEFVYSRQIQESIQSNCSIFDENKKSSDSIVSEPIIKALAEVGVHIEHYEKLTTSSSLENLMQTSYLYIDEDIFIKLCFKGLILERWRPLAQRIEKRQQEGTLVGKSARALLWDDLRINKYPIDVFRTFHQKIFPYENQIVSQFQYKLGCLKKVCDLGNERYQLIEPLNIKYGGFGVVVKAYDTELNRAVAIKLIMPLVAGKGIDSLKEEARKLATFRHSNIVSVYDLVKLNTSKVEVLDNGSSAFLSEIGCVELYGIVMEYVGQGATLDSLSDSPNLQFESRIKPILELCNGVIKLHELNLVHGDIKPQNILLDDNLGLKLTDLGVASSVGSNALFGTHNIFISPRYEKDPAKLKQRVVEDDIYSLALTLLFMFAPNAVTELNNIDNSKKLSPILGKFKYELKDALYISLAQLYVSLYVELRDELHIKNKEIESNLHNYCNYIEHKEIYKNFQIILDAKKGNCFELLLKELVSNCYWDNKKLYSLIQLILGSITSSYEKSSLSKLLKSELLFFCSKLIEPIDNINNFSLNLGAVLHDGLYNNQPLVKEISTLSILGNPISESWLKLPKDNSKLITNYKKNYLDTRESLISVKGVLSFSSSECSNDLILCFDPYKGLFITDTLDGEFSDDKKLSYFTAHAFKLEVERFITSVNYILSANSSKQVSLGAFHTILQESKEKNNPFAKKAKNLPISHRLIERSANIFHKPNFLLTVQQAFRDIFQTLELNKSENELRELVAEYRISKMLLSSDSLRNHEKLFYSDYVQSFIFDLKKKVIQDIDKARTSHVDINSMNLQKGDKESDEFDEHELIGASLIFLIKNSYSEQVQELFKKIKKELLNLCQSDDWIEYISLPEQIDEAIKLDWELSLLKAYKESPRYYI